MRKNENSEIFHMHIFGFIWLLPMLKACPSGSDAFLRRFLALSNPLLIFRDFPLSAHRVKWLFFSNFFIFLRKKLSRKGAAWSFSNIKMSKKPEYELIRIMKNAYEKISYRWIITVVEKLIFADFVIALTLRWRTCLAPHFTRLHYSRVLEPGKLIRL